MKSKKKTGTATQSHIQKYTHAYIYCKKNLGLAANFHANDRNVQPLPIDPCPLDPDTIDTWFQAVFPNGNSNKRDHHICTLRTRPCVNYSMIWLLSAIRVVIDLLKSRFDKLFSST